MRLAATALLLAGVLASACDAEVSKALDVESPTPAATTTDAPTGNPFPPTGAPSTPARPAFEEDEPGRGTQRDQPLAIGSATPVDQWLVRVVGYDPDATEEILAFNSASQPPPEDRVWALARIEATWGGDGRSNAFLNLEWALVDSDGNLWTDTDCAVLPDDLASQDGVPTGETANGTICFVVDPEVQDDVALYIAPLLGEAGTRRWWVAPPEGAGTVLAPDPDNSDSP